MIFIAKHVHSNFVFLTHPTPIFLAPYIFYVLTIWYSLLLLINSVLLWIQHTPCLNTVLRDKFSKRYEWERITLHSKRFFVWKEFIVMNVENIWILIMNNFTSQNTFTYLRCEVIHSHSVLFSSSVLYHPQFPITLNLFSCF